MYQLFIGSFLLSAIHALIPNHWIPLVAMARSEHWSERQTLVVTAICATAHAMSTILLGVVIGILGYQVAERFEAIASLAAPAVLIVMGLYFLLSDLWRPHPCGHAWHASPKAERRTMFWLVTSLSTAMFFSPCMEIEAYYFTAGSFGWQGIAMVSITYLLLTVAGMSLLVHLALRGVRRFEWHFLEHHERLIAGSLLILMGIFTFFVHP